MPKARPIIVRDHEPIVIDEFNGLWDRGGDDSVPIDHFSDCENIQFSQSGFQTREGLDTYRAIGNVIRLYNYTMNDGQSLILMVEGGGIYHSINETTLYGPIATFPDADDFAFYSFSGRAYISPITRTVTAQGQTRETGQSGEFLYVYKGDGTPARKAAGAAPTHVVDTPLVAYNSTVDGLISQGIHIVGVTYSDGIGGESTGMGTTVKPLIYAEGGKQAIVQNLPIGGVGITQREIWMSKAIDPSVFDQAQVDSNTGDYTMYFVSTVNDNTTLSTIIDVADSNLTVPFVAGLLPNPTSGGITAENTNDEGYSDIGLHIIGVVYETDTGYLTAPGPEVFAVQTFVSENHKIHIDNIPVSPDSFVTKRHLIASKAISDYNGDDHGYQLYFIPDGTIEDNTSTSADVSFYDADLIDDATYLYDNFAEIPAVAVLSKYHQRMTLAATANDISLQYFSSPGEPEAVDQVDGLVTIPLDGNPITNGIEYRDVFYAFKQTRTYALNDNGDFPSSWVPIVIDEGVGASIHGVATVLDSGGVNIEYIIVVDYSGVMIFNGLYQRPELSWKIRDYWLDLDRAFFGLIQIMNDSVNQFLYITLPSKRMLFGDYSSSLNAKSIKWAKWRFDVETTTIALINTDTLIIGAEQGVVS